MSSSLPLLYRRRLAFLLLCIGLFVTPPYIYSQNNPRIAVIPFNPIGVSEQDSKVLTELFETGLVNTGSFQVIEQNRVKEIVEAQKYSMSGCTDESCAVELGQLLAADRIVLGTVSSIGGKIIVNAKIIDVEKGENLKADNVRADSMEQMTETIELLAFKLAGLTYTKGAQVQIAREFGELFVQTEPVGADIYINGVKRGKSPDLFSKIPLGEIKVEARKEGLYAEKTVNVAEGMKELSLNLDTVYGNLFIKSSETNVEIFLDGKNLGKLGAGLFKDLPVGNFTLELKGKGVFWSDSVEITADSTTRVDAYPRAFGRIVYELPEGVQAEITGPQYREVIRGKGTLEPVWVGKYTANVTGGQYKPLQKEITINKDSTERLQPQLAYTEAHQKEKFAERIKTVEGYLDTMHQITAEEITEITDLQNDIESSEPSFPDLLKQIGGVLSKAQGKKRMQDIQQQISELETQRKALHERINKINSVRKGNMIGGLVTLGVGVIGGGLTGLFMLLSDQAYQSYQQTTVTDEAVSYKQQFQTLDIASYVAAGSGGASLAVSGILWATRPKAGTYQREFADLEKQISELKGKLQ